MIFYEAGGSFYVTDPGCIWSHACVEIMEVIPQFAEVVFCFSDWMWVRNDHGRVLHVAIHWLTVYSDDLTGA